MRQPEFEMGQLVNATLQYENATCGHVIDTVQDATVCGVVYDPKDGTAGHPWYRYQIMVRGACKYCWVTEDRLYAKETRD